MRDEFFAFFFFFCAHVLIDLSQLIFLNLKGLYMGVWGAWLAALHSLMWLFFFFFFFNQAISFSI